jgi:hypothetical protein
VCFLFIARLVAAAQLVPFLVLRALLKASLSQVAIDLRAAKLRTGAHHINGGFRTAGSLHLSPPQLSSYSLLPCIIDRGHHDIGIGLRFVAGEPPGELAVGLQFPLLEE